MSVLIESAIRAGLLALAAFAVLRVMRVTTAAARHAVWTVVLAGMIVLPVWTLWGPKASIPVNAPRAIRVAPPAVPALVMPTDATASAPAAPREHPNGHAEIATPTTTPEGRTIPWLPLVGAIYAVGVAVLLGRLFIGTLRAHRLIRQAAQHPGFLTSAACSAPVTAGWLRPVIVLPESRDSWSSAQFDAVMLHEREHARRRDPLVQWIAFANRAIFWFHPLAWWLQRHLAELAEDACDTAVLSKGHRPADYCEYLLSMARAVTSAGVRVDVVGAAMPGAFLSQRIGRILSAAPESRFSAWRLAFTLSTSIALSAVVVAGTFAPVDTPRVLPLQAAASQPLSDDWFADDEWHLETAPLMSPQEMEHYKALRTSAEREAFIDGFWKQNASTRGTSPNEFRREFERRIRYANEHYADPDSAATFGYQTDRGRWYVVFGQPDATRVSGSNRNVDANGKAGRVEEWDYRLLDDVGSNVTVRFDVGSYFGCSWRGGKYRIVSPSPVSRFDGVTSGGSARRPFAKTYPGHFVYLSVPIDEQAVAIRWGMRAGQDGQIIFDEDNGPIDYIQGQIGSVSDDPARPTGNRSRPAKRILEHLQGLPFFEPNGIACTEQLPPAMYTLKIESRLMNGALRTDSVTFTVD